MSKATTKHLRDTFRDVKVLSFDKVFGVAVRKLSGKPFQNGHQVAAVSNILFHPVTGKLAFELEGCVGAVEAHMCYLDSDHHTV